MSDTKFTREELYKVVWSKPLTTLAKEYSISDNGLRKICKKHDIPLPKSGHWQKVQFGKKVDIIPLPKANLDTNSKIILSERENDKNGEEHYLTLLARRTKEIISDSSLTLIVPEKLSHPDPLIQIAKRNLSEVQPEQYGDYKGVLFTSENVLSIAVTKVNVKRALLFMDTLIKLFKQRGHELLIEKDTSYVVIDTIKFKIRCREKYKRIIIKEERWDRSELVPTGLLTFRLDHYQEKIWEDGKNIKLEDQLAKILATFEVRAAKQKIQNEENRLRREEYDRKRALEIQQQKELEWENKKVEKLISDAENWDKSNTLLRFLKAVESETSNKMNDETSDWLIWAKEKVKEIDPLKDGVESLVEKYKLNKE